MIPNCRGCDEEWMMACDYVNSGFHFATTKDRIGLGERKHLVILLVDDKGKVVVG